MHLNSFRARKVIGSLKKWAPALSKNHSIDALKLITSDSGCGIVNCGIGIGIGNGFCNLEMMNQRERRGGGAETSGKTYVFYLRQTINIIMLYF